MFIGKAPPIFTPYTGQQERGCSETGGNVRLDQRMILVVLVSPAPVTNEGRCRRKDAGWVSASNMVMD